MFRLIDAAAAEYASAKGDLKDPVLKVLETYPEYTHKLRKQREFNPVINQEGGSNENACNSFLLHTGLPTTDAT